MDEITVRSFDESDYSLFSGWMDARGWAALPPQFLPATGMVASFRGEPVCMGFKYTTDSMMSWIEWVVAHPQSDKKIRSFCLDMLIDSLTKGEPGEFFMTCIDSDHVDLCARYERLGFVKADSNMQVLIKGSK